MSTSRRTATAAVAAQSAYEGNVALEALARAGGACPNLKGHVYEVLCRDAINADPVRRLAGDSARLVASRNAPVVDMVIENGGRIVQRLQLKDAPASAAKLAARVARGDYASARLAVTRETAKNLARHAESLGGKTVVVRGSSSYNASIAAKAGVVAKGGLGNAVMGAAKSGGTVGAVVSGTVAVVSGIGDLIDGRRNAGDVAIDVARQAAGGYLSGAAASAASTAVGGAIGSAIAAGAGTTAASIGLGAGSVAAVTVAAPVVAAIGVAILSGYAVYSLWEALWD